MSDMSWKKDAVESVRLTVYGVLVINGIFIQYFAPFHYICDYNEQTCVMCGMRTAVNLWLSGDFSAAIESNPLILLIAFIALVMIGDTAVIFWGRHKRRNKATDA